MNKLEEYKTELEVLRDQIKDLIENSKQKQESNKQKYLKAYKDNDNEYFNHGLGYERSLIESIEDLEELIK